MSNRSNAQSRAHQDSRLVDAPATASAEVMQVLRNRAFAVVYREQSNAVYRVAARTGGVRFAHDVTQEVFLRLWRNPAMFDPERGSLRALLVTAARNLSIDTLRAEQNRVAREVRTIRRAPPADDTGPEPTAVTRDSARIVALALRHLPKENRAAIVMAFYGGLSYRETARALNEPEGTVKSRIRAGLRQLRAELASADLLTRPVEPLVGGCFAGAFSPRSNG